MVPTRVSHARDRYPLRWVTRSGLRSPYPAPVLDDTSASMISSTSTLSASRRKSTSPSTPLLRISSSRSILSLTTVVLLSQARLCPLRMTWWSLFIQTLYSWYTTSWDSTGSDHSLCAAPNPRRINRRTPCPSLTCPNTGSTSTPRFLYRARPRFVSSSRSILSLGLSPFGIRPRGHPFSRSIFRCFQSLVVAIRSSGISGQEQALMLASLQYPASARPGPKAGCQCGSGCS